MKTKLLRDIAFDPHLTSPEKKLLKELLEDSKKHKQLTNGIRGAAIAYAIASFLKMSRNSRMLVSLAGFGIGRYILTTARNDKKFMSFDPKTRYYNV